MDKYIIYLNFSENIPQKLGILHIKTFCFTGFQGEKAKKGLLYLYGYITI